MTQILTFLIAITYSAFAAALTLEDYRAQVAGHDPGYEGAALQKEGSMKALPLQDAATDTQLFMQLFDYDDHRPTANPNFQGTRINNREISIGLEKQTAWGPQFRVAQKLLHSTTFDVSPSAIPRPNYYDAYSEIEVVFPLWRNLFGAETRANLQVSKSDSQIKRLKTDAQWLTQVAELEMAFYTYAARLENLKTQKEILVRAEKILSWARSQRARGLVDSTDVYQAQAAVTLRTLELTEAERELRAAARKLNELRGLDSTEVTENLEVAPLNMALLKQSPQANRVRLDDQISDEQSRMVEGEFKALREKSSPNLDLVLKSTRVGRDGESDEAMDRYSENSKSLYYVGLSFKVPLNIPKYANARKGFGQLSRGQELLYQSKIRSNQRGWKDFVDTGEVLFQKIEMLRALEQTQKLKSDAERERIQKGRSTTFQVLTFEQDYNTARSQRILAELAARSFVTQLPFYQ